MSAPIPELFIATSAAERGDALAPVARALGLQSRVLVDVEGLLYHTRGAVPAAIVLDDALVASVPQLDLVSLLRRRKPLANVPLICLGEGEVADAGQHMARHTAALSSGADLYLAQASPELLRAYLKRYLDKAQADAGLRETLARLRQFEDAFKEAERVKDDLTHMLVHDLKSPIASVMGLLDHTIDIMHATDDEQGVVELLSLARGESQHLLNLAANILDVRRMKEGHMPYDPAWVENLTGLVETALGDARSSHEERHFSVLVRPEAERIFADKGLMRRVLANLFANAVKHTRRGGHVDFRAWKEDENIVLSVRDDGEGIPEADHKRIFNAFEQSRHTVHDRFDTGMGLTFCKLAVEKHGGTIWVESKVGRGSTFYFSVPVEAKELLTDGVVLAQD